MTPDPIRLAIAMTILALPLPTAAQVNVMGPCVDGFRWVSTAMGQSPVATYAACQPVQPFVTVTCGAGGLWMRVDHEFPGIEPGTQLFRSLAVDETEFPVLMRSGLSDIPGLNYVEFRLDELAIRALSAGFRAEISVAPSPLVLHLSASNDALGVLTRNC